MTIPIFIESKRRRQTGTTVEVWKDFDGEPGWHTVCSDHGGICVHSTRADAIAWAPDPQGWCPGCQDAAGVDTRSPW